MELREKEVRFDQYCKTCENADLVEYESPCNECLDDCYNDYSHRPTLYKEKEDANLGKANTGN